MTAPVTVGTGTTPEPAGKPARRGPARPGPGILTVFSLVIGLLLVAGIATGAVLLSQGKIEVAYKLPAVFKLREGMCFSAGPNDQSLKVQQCASPHVAEVFATFPLAGQIYPGTKAAQSLAQAGCVARIGAYMDPVLATTAMDQEYVYPDAIAWQAGERTVICDVRSAAGRITGSIRRATPPPPTPRGA